jgi:hypothetical protein
MKFELYCLTFLEIDIWLIYIKMHIFPGTVAT